MRTLEFLSDPALRSVLMPGIVTGVAIAATGAVLSVPVVLKRLSFIGQGISHSAFGGMGVAAILGFAGVNLSAGEAAAQFAIVTTFCLLAAMLISRLAAQRGTSADTAIGIVLVASMALGVLLLALAFKRGLAAGQAWESVLFGSVLGVSWRDATLACIVSAAALAVFWWFRRPLLFWAFDEHAAPAFGVPVARTRALMMALLCLQIVASMRLAGVILATAMLVLPGASALRMSTKLSRVMTLSVCFAILGLVLGMITSLELDLPPGPSIVGAMCVVYGGCRVIGERR